MLELTIKVVSKQKDAHHPIPQDFHVETHGNLITITIRGKINGQFVHVVEREVGKAVQNIRSHGGKPVALVDATQVKFSDVTSSARSQARRLLTDIPVERWAIFGTSHIGMLVDYIGRATGMGNKLKYFSDKRAASAWLHGQQQKKERQSSIGLVAGMAIALIGLCGIIGWHVNNPQLTSLLPHLRPINPVAAVGLIALGGAFICYWQGALKPLRILGWTGILLGIAALLPLSIDTILYSEAVRVASHSNLADSAAICFILSGILGLLANREGKWIQPAEYTFAGTMLIIATFNVNSIVYATDFAYSIGDNFIMALNLGLAFMITAIAMIILVLLRRTQSALQRVSRSGWLIVVALMFVQIATYASWSQTVDRQKADTQHAFTTETTSINEQVNTRLQAYINALHGFRGLFIASSNVSQGDFEAYNDTLNLKQSYPGVRALAFIAAVETKDLQSFAAEQRRDTSLNPGGNPQFAIREQSTEPLHFISTYAADSPTTTILGRDLTSIPGRSAIYNNALRSGGYYSSGTITFPATGTQPGSQGFFIATPVRTANSARPIGVVTANFNYKDFFDAVLRSTGNQQDFSFSVRDTDSGNVIYTSGKQPTGNDLFEQKINISLAQNQSWQLTIQAAKNFGTAASQDRAARAVLFVGEAFTLLLAGIFIIQIRARGQALALADAVTEDLQIERDNIAALHIKDEALLAGIGEGLLFIDKTGKVEVTNEAATNMLGYSENELIGKNIFETLRALDEKGELIPPSKRPSERALKHSKTTSTRLTYIRKDYHQIPVKVTAAPIILRGELIGAIEVFSDISREKQLEHMKDEFLSVASHELRTPMGAIRANLSMILSGDYGPVNKDLVEPLSDMKNSTIRLVELVSDLLNVARIEAGRMKFELKEFNIQDAANTVVTDLAPLGKEKGVKVIATPVKNVKTVQGDIDKVKQILTNLIGNSLKFTDKGSITVTLTPHDDGVEINVTDTGIGITPEDQAKLFGKFNQITSAQAGKPAGTGLGLYISREMVRKMGGEMWIKQSALMQGSTFAFTLPYANSSTAKKVSHAIEQESKLHPDQV